MAKNTAEGALLTRARIIEVAFEISMNEGFEKATLARISKLVGITRSGVNAHFKKKSEIAAELAPIYADIIRKPLCFDSPIEFWRSWVDAFDNNETFRKAILTAGGAIPKLDGINGLFDAIQGDPEEVKMCAYQCIGYTVIHSEKPQ